MTGQNETGEALRGIAADVHSLLNHGLELAAAVAAGALLARSLRRHGLHWSWAAAGLALAVSASGPLGPLDPPLLAALTTACVRGRSRHREDLDTGLDLARAAREHRTPAAALRSLARAVGEHGSLADAARAFAGGVCERMAVGRAPRTAAAQLLLGRDGAGRAVRVGFEPSGGGHTLVVGATGSGKTVTQSLIAERAIEQGRGAIFVDPKGDEGLRTRLAAAAERCGRPFVEWTPSGPSAYNPYARGGETEIADRLLAGERFTEPHYLRQAQRYLGHAVRALRACGVEVSLSSILQALDPLALEQLLRGAREDLAVAGHAYLDSLTARQLRDLAGVRDRLAILAESDVGRWLDPAEGRPGFDLLGAARARSVVYFALESDSRPLLAQMLGAAIVQDLQSAVAELQSAPVPTLVAIDEFAAVSAEGVVALFGRARSAGIALLLGTQEIADLRLPGRERTLEQILGNLSLLIAHRQVVPASAELVSRLSGERGAWRVSRSSGGRTTATRTAEPRLSPGELAGLAPGRAAVVPLGLGDCARVARILPGGEAKR